MMDATQQKPIVLALMGLPGSGKTTLARALARKLGWSVVSRDEVRQAMFHPCTYSEDEKQLAVEATFAAVVRHVASGTNTIVDGMTFSRPGQLESLRAKVRRHCGKLLPIVLDCPVPVAQGRIEKDRMESRSMPADRDEDLVTRVAKRFRVLPKDALILDAKKNTDELVEMIIASFLQ